MNLRWTDAGRAALAAAGHVGVAAVRLEHFAIGDGSGPGGAADDNRAALRNERHRAATAGQAAESRIALRADLTPDASYSITEAGIFGRAGNPPSASQLLLYWTDNGAAAGAAAAGTELALPAVIEFQNAEAEVAVAVGGNIVFGAVDPASESEFGSTRYATAAETADASRGDRAVSPKGLHAAAGRVLATLLGSAAGDGTVYQLKGAADGSLIVEERTQDGETSAMLAASGRLISGNSAAIAALANRVTAAEAAALALPAADGLYGVRRKTAGGEVTTAYERLPFLLSAYQAGLNQRYAAGTDIAINGVSSWRLSEAGTYLVTAWGETESHNRSIQIVTQFSGPGRLHGFDRAHLDPGSNPDDPTCCHGFQISGGKIATVKIRVLGGAIVLTKVGLVIARIA